MSTPDVQWRPVPGYEGCYDVSSAGQIKSHYRGRLLTLTQNQGYLQVALHGGGTRRSMRVHQVVALAFLGAMPEGYDTRHLDGNPLNNDVSNLRYGTPSENTLDSVIHGTHLNKRKTHCPQGHEYTPENLKTRTPRHWRECRICCNEREAARKRGARAARKAAA